MASELADWLGRREPRPPAEIRSLLAADLPGADPAPGELVEAALERLRRARREPAERSAAFELLAADAWLTYACEAAVDPATGSEAAGGEGADWALPDPEASLGRILARVADAAT